jgi:hypothetical protein
MSNSLINRWVFRIPLDDVKTSTEDTTLTDGCFLCGKKVDNPRYSIHLLDSGDLVSSDQPFENSQGFFTIGNECRKKLPNNFYF